MEKHASVPKFYLKGRWTRELLFTISWNYLFTDLVTALLVRYSTDTPFFSNHQRNNFSSTFSFLHAIRLVTGARWTHDFLSIFSVVIGLRTPSHQPSAFGSFSKNCYTIGGFWGRIYHQ
jgi:hypothetical protein